MSDDDGIKVVVVGDGAVGKTCLLTVYKEGVFPDKYIPTVFDNYSARVRVDEEIYPVMLWDTAGQEGFAKLRPLAYGESNAFILCFSLDSKVSLMHCHCGGLMQQVWLPELRQYCPDAQVVLVGTKSDLLKDPDFDGEFVSDESADEMKRTLHCGAFVKCSAKENDNVNLVFETAVRLHLDYLARQGGKCCSVM